MRYGEGLLEEILRKTELVQLVGRRIKLERRGRIFWGLCPFHKEKSPSFKVENERRNYKCFGCGAGGDAFRWLMETEGLSFPEAVERLAGESGVELPKWTPQDEAREQRRKSLYEIVESACVYYERQLRAAAGARARSYLVARGFGEDVWERFRLGYAPPGRTGLLDELKAKGVEIEDLVTAGLSRADGDDRRSRDFFFDRLMFPIGDARGRIVAFGARALESDAKPKYINTGETPLFSKGHLLYNFAAARIAALKTGALVVAEGYLDVIALVGAGIEAAVAPLGTALTADQLALLWRTTPEPIFSFDGDEAGLRAAHRAAELALPLLKPGHSLRFALLPSGEDPDSLIRAQGAGPMKSLLEKAIPLADMIWHLETEGRTLDTPERKAALVSGLNSRLQLIPNSDVRRFYLDAIAEKISGGVGLRAYVYGDQIRLSGASSRNRDADARGRRGPTARRGFVAVSAAVKSSSLVSVQAANRKAASADPGLAGIRIARPPPPISPREGAADGFGPAGSDSHSASRRLKENEVLALLLQAPEMLEHCHEVLAALPLADRSLDSLRHELLNLAASGFRLETGRLEDHLVRAGMATLVERLRTRPARNFLGSDATPGHAEREGSDADTIETRWWHAAAQLREMAHADPERRQALERFKSEADEESWRLLRAHLPPGEA